MKRYSFCMIILLGILCSINNPANAITIVDPDNFSDGDDISSIPLLGVTLSAFGFVIKNSPDGSVFSLDSNIGSTGQVFGNQKTNDDFSTEWGDFIYQQQPTPFQRFVADFDDFMNFVSVDIIPTDPLSRAILKAFDDSSIIPLESVTTSPGIEQTISILRSNVDISYITIANPDDISGREPFLIDKLQFGIIPEPSTMILFGSGLLALAGFRRKLKKA